MDKSFSFKTQTEGDIINGFINKPSIVGSPTCRVLNAMFDNEDQEDPLEVLNNYHIHTAVVHNSIPIEIEPSKTLNINGNLTIQQCKELTQILQKYM